MLEIGVGEFHFRHAAFASVSKERFELTDDVLNCSPDILRANDITAVLLGNLYTSLQYERLINPMSKLKRIILYPNFSVRRCEHILLRG